MQINNVTSSTGEGSGNKFYEEEIHQPKHFETFFFLHKVNLTPKNQISHQSEVSAKGF